MRYLCLIYIDRDRLDENPASECLAYADRLAQHGYCEAAEALRAPETARSIRLGNGSLTVTDGPFAETKEVLMGFYVLDADSFEELLPLVMEIPPAPSGVIEVRPLI